MRTSSQSALRQISRKIAEKHEASTAASDSLSVPA
jgi:hypothetical protein